MASPAREEVLERLSDLPDELYRAIISEWDRARLRGSGEMHIVVRTEGARELVVVKGLRSVIKWEGHKA